MREVRRNYIDFFNRAIATYRDAGRDIYPEICLALSQNFAKKELYRLYVVDIVEKCGDANKLIDLNVDPTPAGHPTLTIATPLAWNGIEFRCTAALFAEERLISWGKRWISDEAPPFGSQDGLTGIIHSVTAPVEADGIVQFSVDFGSAPLEAFSELVGQLGENLICIGSYSLLEDR